MNPLPQKQPRVACRARSAGLCLAPRTVLERTVSDLIRLYSYWRSSAAFRVRIALNLKALRYDYLAVDLTSAGGQQHAAEFHKLNPQELLPVLIDGATKPIGLNM